MADDDDDIVYGGLYENGRWMWDGVSGGLKFVSYAQSLSEEKVVVSHREPLGALEFRDEPDLIEQIRYRRRYQRKLKEGDPDIVTLQDIKDIVLFTAPPLFLRKEIVEMIHTPTGERFLRALILYCAYTLQTTDKLAERHIELQKKIKTPYSEMVEEELHENLSDLRLLVAKEYCSIVTGAAEMKPFHHKGPSKKLRSLMARDARTFEIFTQISVQMVYVCLGRKFFKLIESEVHRLLKSARFNAVDHRNKAIHATYSEFENKRPTYIETILLGKCEQRERQLNTHSPLMHAFYCPGRKVDYRMMGLGVIKYRTLPPRLQYFRLVLASSEADMAAQGLQLGIIGMPRARFDTMLKLLPPATETKSKSSVSVTRSKLSYTSASVKDKIKSTVLRTYPEIVLPPKESVVTTAPVGMVEEPDDVNPVDEVQRRIWLSKAKAMRSLTARHRSNKVKNKA